MMRRRFAIPVFCFSTAFAWLSPAFTQSPAPQPPPTQLSQTAAPQQTAPPATPGATVLFERDLSLDPNAPPNSQSHAAPSPPAELELSPGDNDPINVTDAERDAPTFTAYDLDVHLTPASAGISVRAGLMVRNDGPSPLNRLVFQITSSMRWDAFSSAPAQASTTAGAGATSPLPFQPRRVATDADHTGWAEEAVISLPQPLAPGASIALTALYSGAIPPAAERLERIGAPPDRAENADWDAIAVSNPLVAPATSGTPAPLNSETVLRGFGTALRGFGNALWYPVAAPPVFLGDGNKLFQAVGHARQRQSAATVRLRLAIEFTGDPPNAAFFCGRREPLTAIRDNPELPVAESPGIATAVFDSQPLGFRTPSLFVTDEPPTPAGPPTSPDLIAAVTDHYDALPSYSDAAKLVEPLLTGWLGAQPASALNLIDHPGQPFEDDTLLVRPIGVEDPNALAPSLIHSLSHAWIHSARPWIDQGVPQFIGLLWAEHSLGRSAALDQLQDDAHVLAFTGSTVQTTQPENHATQAPGPSASSSASTLESASHPAAPSGQSLIDASSDVYYRTKAAAVFWMLRDITGDNALKQALQAYRLDPKLDLDPAGFELTLEKFAHKDLRWFFDDWVYRDRGLPDLSILNVTPRELEKHNGLPSGWLISVDVRNDGDAEAEVPIIVRSAPGLRGATVATETERLRIPAHSSASHRIPFAGTPAEVQVNDGGVPEIGSSIHTRQLVLPAK
jgi:hypothetical protein